MSITITGNRQVVNLRKGVAPSSIISRPRSRAIDRARPANGRHDAEHWVDAGEATETATLDRNPARCDAKLLIIRGFPKEKERAAPGKFNSATAAAADWARLSVLLIVWPGFFQFLLMDWGNPQFCGALHNRTDTITYKIQSRLGNDMFSAPHLSTGGWLNLPTTYILTLMKTVRGT